MHALFWLCEKILGTCMEEPLLAETKSRHVMFPVEYPDVFEMYKLAQSVFWTADEINFAQDLVDLDKLTSNERHFIHHVLAFFAASDGIVMENLTQRFSQDIPKPEVRAFYAFQNAIEAVHSETYSLLIDTYVKDDGEKARLFDAVNTFPAIRDKAGWAERWMSDKQASFAQRLVAFAIVEGLFFQASFCAIFWLRERGLLPALSFANQLIARDENQHVEFAALLYSHLVNRLSEADVATMVREAVDIERRFITESIPCSMIGMNTDLMTQYIEYTADRLLAMLGHRSVFNKTNPFDFMERSASETKTSFFEKRNADYSRAGMTFVPGHSSMPTQLRVNVTDDF